jgi:bifunctional enzyme CysN/CysC
MGQPPEPRFPGLLRADRNRHGQARRCGPRAAIGQDLTVSRIVTLDGDLDEAVAGQSVTLCFADEIDCSRGDVIAIADTPPKRPTSSRATLVWMADEPLHVGRAYWLKLGTQMVSVTVQQPKYVVNVNTMEHLAAKTLELNAIGVAELATDKPVVFEAYAENRTLGGFILIDKITNHRGGRHAALLAAAGAECPLAGARHQPRRARRLKNQKPACCGSPGCRVRANRPSPTSSRRSCTG